MNAEFRGYFRLRSPLSHIHQTRQSTSYLVREPIFDPEAGEVNNVFAYAGNAWRGQLRDLAASYMLTRIGNPRLSPDAFHLLYSGGKIGGEQTVDLEAARRVRRSIPMMALWGGGAGNQILPGKINVNICYPVCREARPVLRFTEITERTPSYRTLTFLKEFSRMDDAKNPLYENRLALPGFAEQATALDDEGVPQTATAKRHGPSDQMRMASELLIAGVALETSVELRDANEIELGCFLSALLGFARFPHIGGQSGKGYGLVDLVYHLIDLDTGESQPFITVEQSSATMSERAGLALAAYDHHLLHPYDEALAGGADEIRRVLAVAG